jgi:hypothetical protein
MGRLVVVLDDGVGVSPAELAAVWADDAEARAAGGASVEAAPPGDFFSGLELVVIPLLVNLASSAITGLVGRLVDKARPDRAGQDELEITETTGADGDRVVVVRLRGVSR